LLRSWSPTATWPTRGPFLIIDGEDWDTLHDLLHNTAKGDKKPWNEGHVLDVEHCEKHMEQVKKHGKNEQAYAPCAPKTNTWHM
jgi:hypothetical protein